MSKGPRRPPLGHDISVFSTDSQHVCVCVCQACLRKAGREGVLMAEKQTSLPTFFALLAYILEVKWFTWKKKKTLWFGLHT